MLINDFHDIAYLPSRLLYVNHAPMFQPLAFDERQKIVIECQEHPLVCDCVPQLLAVWVTKRAFISGGVNRPPASAEPVSNRQPNTLVTVQRPCHTDAGSDDADRKSSI
nr:hypothetical protein [Halorubrum sp. Ib24]